MDRKGFQAWLSVVDGLSEAQKAEAMEVLAGRPVGEAALAAVELGVGEDRRCPRCGTTGAGKVAFEHVRVLSGIREISERNDHQW